MVVRKSAFADCHPAWAGHDPASAGDAEFVLRFASINNPGTPSYDQILSRSPVPSRKNSVAASRWR